MITSTRRTARKKAPPKKSAPKNRIAEPQQDFRGRLLIGAQWFEHYYTGERVAVLAAGSEAAAIVPEVLATADSVTVFEESPAWIVPIAVPSRRLSRLVARLYLRWSVSDAWTRRQLTPHKRYDSRRVTVNPSYYEALQDPRTRLVHWPAYAIAEQGVRAVDGVEYRVDTIVVGATSKFAQPLAAGETRNL